MERELEEVTSLYSSVYKMNAALDKTYTSLMPKQIDALIAAGKGQDVIVTVPTGYGKSLIFQVLPFRWRTAPKVVVASPLDAIIAEQASCNRTVLIDQTLVNELVVKNVPAAHPSPNCKRFIEGDFIYAVGHLVPGPP